MVDLYHGKDAKFLYELKEKLGVIRVKAITKNDSLWITMSSALLELVVFMINNYVNKNNQFEFKWYHFKRHITAVLKVISFLFYINKNWK